MTEIPRIVKIVKAAYDGDAWHGPNIKSVLAKVDPKDKDARVGKGHSIIELVGHMAVWRKFAIEQISGNKDFKVTDEMNFPTLTEWETALQTLEQTQIQLINALSKLAEGELGDEVATRKYSIYTLLHGIIHHDLYHLGQIVMIQKSLA